MTFNRAQSRHGVDLLPSATLVLWLICLTVGLVGICWPPIFARGVPPLEPVEVRMISVENALAEEPLQAPQATVPQALDTHPQAAEPGPLPPDLAKLPPAPPMLAVAAAPTPQMAFAVPVKARPTEIKASTAPPVAAPTEPAVEHLTFGQAAGAQPAPDYPVEAALAGEQGAVKVRFDVNTDGQVLDAQVVSPCRWPLLNEAAARAIRETWQFPPGLKRAYDVSIVFQLNQ